MFRGNLKVRLSQKGIESVERDVSEDEEALAELETLGAMTTSVMVIDGQVVVGFDLPNLERLLGN